MNLEDFPWSDSAKRMLSYVTDGWYDNSYIGKWLYEVMGMGLDDVRKVIEELPYQLFVETATWGLMYHEIKWGIPIKNHLPYKERRELICRKRDGRIPLNPYQMEGILKSMTGREAHVDDMSGPVNTFTVRFEEGSSPVDLAAVIGRLNLIKQSHVTFSVCVVSATETARINTAVGRHIFYRTAAIIDSYTVTEEVVQAMPVYAGTAMGNAAYKPAAITDGYKITEEAIRTDPVHAGGYAGSIKRSVIEEG